MQLPETHSAKVDFLHNKVKNLLKDKLTDEQIISELANDGIDSFYAQTIIDNVNNDRSDNKNFWKLIFGGAFFTISGILINYFSYTIAVARNSWFFYLFWGILVFGIITICRAFIIFKK